MKKRSRVTHPRAVTVPADNRPLVAPIYQSVKFTFDDVAETKSFFGGGRDGYYYSRESNPTLRQLGQLLCDLQGRDGCLLAGSGVAAIALPLLTLLKAGDHVVHFAELYSPTRALIHGLLGRFGVTSTLLSIDDLDGLERELAARPTRLVAFESPTNPALKVADLPRITAAARRHGALTLLDNTLAGFHQHGQYDVDIFAHSLTKFASGHGDVMGGAIIARQSLLDEMWNDFVHIGPTLDPHAAFLILRGMKTYYLRRDAQCGNAARVAEFLSRHPAVARVRYPGLAGDPGHARAAAQMADFGSIVTFDVQGGVEQGNRVAESLELFTIAASLGSTESLVVPPGLLQPRGLTEGQRAWTDIRPGTLRLSIGVEDPDDLVADLDRALQAAAAG